MKERPILFSGAMVRALLASTKTQTRRPVKPQPPASTEWMSHFHHPDDADRPYWWAGACGELMDFSAPCPYGMPGDRLWVRETFAYHTHALSASSSEDGPWVYAADGLFAGRDRLDDRWRPSIHMPRAASRITLEVTGVRVERLQDISEADARAEGAPPGHPSIDSISREFGYADFPRSWYAQLWDQINGPGSWDANPWVWVVEFKRVGDGA